MNVLRKEINEQMNTKINEWKIQVNITNKWMNERLNK